MPDPVDPLGGGGDGGGGRPDPEEYQRILRAISEQQRLVDKMSEDYKDMDRDMSSMSESGQTLKDVFKDVSSTVAELTASIKEQTILETATTEQKQEYVEMLLQEKILKNDLLAASKLELDYSNEWKKISIEGYERNKKLKEEAESRLTILDKIKKVTAETGSNTGAQAMFGMGGMMSAMGGAIGGLIPALGPIGGLIGFMLAGKQKELEWTAVGESARQQFDVIGGATKKFGATMADTARALSKDSMALAGDIGVVAKSLAETGVSAEAAAKKMDGFSAYAGASENINNLATATLAADKKFEVAAGTFGKLAGTLSKDFGAAADKSLRHLLDMADAASKAGVNAMSFVNAMMEVNSSLRLMHGNMEQAGAVQIKLIENFKALGMTEAMAGQYGAAGLKGAMGSITKLDVGMSAVMGERLGMGTGLDAWRMMQSPQARLEAAQAKGLTGEAARKDSELNQVKMLTEFVKMAKESGAGTKSEQLRFLEQKVTGGDIQGAEAIIKIAELQEKGLLESKEGKDAMKTIENSLKTEAQKTDEFKRIIDNIKDAIAVVGNGLLTMILESIKGIYNAVMGIAAYGGGDADLAELYLEKSMENFGAVGEGMNKIMQAGKGLYSTLVGDDKTKGLLGSAFGREETDREKELDRKIEEMLKIPKRKNTGTKVEEAYEKFSGERVGTTGKVISQSVGTLMDLNVGGTKLAADIIKKAIMMGMSEPDITVKNKTKNKVILTLEPDHSDKNKGFSAKK